MAKSATKTKTEEVVEEKKEETKKEIVPVSPERLKQANLVPYTGAGEIAVFGNSYLAALVKQAALETEAQQALALASEQKQFLSFEMTKAVFDIFQQTKDTSKPLDVYAVFSENKKDIAKLNSQLLIHMGIMKREISEDGDEVIVTWQDKDVENLYAYDTKLKEENEPEFTKRFNNRKRLNARLSDAYKAVCALIDNGNQPDDLFYSEDDSNRLIPTIKNAPKAIGGDAGTVQMNTKKPVPGATVSPTMSSLINLATKSHTGEKSDRLNKSELQKNGADMTITDEQFGSIVNTLRTAITNLADGKFSDEQKKQITNLIPFLEQVAENF